MRVRRSYLAWFALPLSAMTGCGAATTSSAQPGSVSKSSSAASAAVTPGVSAPVRAYEDIVQRDAAALNPIVQFCLAGDFSGSNCHDALASGPGAVSRFLDDLSHATVPAQLQALDGQLRAELPGLMRAELALLAALKANDHQAYIVAINQLWDAGLDPGHQLYSTIHTIVDLR